MERPRRNILAILLVILMGTGLVALVAGLAMLGLGEPVSRRAVLEVDLARAYPEVAVSGVLDLGLFERGRSLREVVSAIHRAADDDRVVGLYARVGAARTGLASLQEIRDAIVAFGKTGKKTVAFSDTFGEWAPGNGAYYLATAFDEIYLQPSGDVGLTGILFETTFVKEALDKLGLDARMDHRREYKNAMNSLTETGYTPAHEEALRAVAESQFQQLVSGIAAGRGLGEERVRELFDGGPYLAAEALEARLVDGLAYRDEVREAMLRELEDAETIALSEYRRRVRPRLARGIGVALIYGAGSVVRGESGYDPLSGALSMGSETVSQAFRDAIDDDDVKAILFRVNSPGGSYVASDTIWRETVRARDAGKPVIVSMGDVAGSGGYFVAMAADAIVAHPGTVTGSIGVYGGKIVSRGLWSKLGITWDAVSTSRHARMWSGNFDFSESEWLRMEASLDRIYEDFTSKVAAGRGLELEQVEAMAKGRLWTGQDALGLGLVDELGGFPAARRRVREALGVSEHERLRLVVLPRPRSPLELLVDRGASGGRGAALGDLLLRARPALEAARRLGLLGTPPGALEMPGF